MISKRLAARFEIFFVCGIGLFALVLSGALSWSAGLIAGLAVLAFGSLWYPEVQAGTRLGKSEVTDPQSRDAERQAIVDAMPDPAWMLDEAGMVLHANALAKSIFANLRSGVRMTSVVRDPELIEAVALASESGAVRTATLHARVPIERRLAVTVAPLTSSGGAVPAPRAPAVLVTLRDLTEQDRLAQMRADFVANASHELRTPLASLRGFVETLQGPARDDPAARERFLGIMAKQAERMTRLIDDLLSLSRVEMRQHLTPTAIVDLVEIAQLSIQALEPQAREGNIVLAFTADHRPLHVRGDRDELLQVLQNLLQNAIKYGRVGGRVDVRLARRERIAGHPPRVEVVVADDGPGIPAEHIPRLTERFYRVNAPQSRDKGGTGLGLAIVKHIVSRHAGDLHITSNVGAGATFTVLLDEDKKS